MEHPRATHRIELPALYPLFGFVNPKAFIDFGWETSADGPSPSSSANIFQMHLENHACFSSLDRQRSAEGMSHMAFCIAARVFFGLFKGFWVVVGAPSGVQGAEAHGISGVNGQDRQEVAAVEAM